jgi:hypothetical protein
MKDDGFANRQKSGSDLGRLEKNADRAVAGHPDQGKIREMILETVERVTGKRTDSPTAAEWVERWIRTEKGPVPARTMMRYEQIVRDFLSSIGPKAQAPLEALSTQFLS